jgi:hypothetical protein
MVSFWARNNIHLRLKYLLVALLLVCSFVIANLARSSKVEAQTDTFTSSGTWSVPVGITSATFEAIGAGGGGGSASGANQGGGGGGGGAYSSGVFTVSNGQSYTVTVATAPAGGASGGDGTNGGDSAVILSGVDKVRAQGGRAGLGTNNGGIGKSGGSAASGVGTVLYGGGSGADGSSTASGSGGGAAGESGDGGNADAFSTGTGNGINSGTGGVIGSDGGAYGGGGSGAFRSTAGTTNGGSGGAGIILITYGATNQAPSAPTLIAPSSGATNVSTSPVLRLRTADTDNDYLRYRIYLYQSNCTTAVGTSPFNQNTDQTGWSGQDANVSSAYVGSATLTSSTIATFTGAHLSSSTTYCWKADAIDPGGTNTYGSSSATQTFTTGINAGPSAPTLLSPTSGATGTSLSPLFQMKSTDADGDYLKYKITIFNSDCSTGAQTYIQATSQVGWLQQNQENNLFYTGGSSLSGSSTAMFGGSSLSGSTTYCWKAAAIDPYGTNVYSSFSGTQLFTTGTSNAGTKDIRGGSTIRGGSIVR